MKKYLLLFVAFLLLNSCSTLFSKNEHHIQVSSNSPTASLNVNNVEYKLPAKIKVERSKEDLKVVFSNDTLKKELILKSRLSSKFLIGNLFLYPPISYGIDFTNVKRFGYKRNIFIKVNDTIVNFSNIPFAKKVSNIFKPSFDDNSNDLKFHLSMPWMNSFCYMPTNKKRVNSIGYIGISAGFDYFYNKNSFASIRTDAITNFFLPIPVPVERDEGEYTYTNSVNVSVLNNKKLNKFIYGYGLNYARNYWNYRNDYYDKVTEIYVRERKSSVNQNIGLNLNSYFQMTDNFYIGIVFKPSFITFDSGVKFNYEHTLSLDLAWKINLFNVSRK